MSLSAVILGFLLAHPSLCITKYEPVSRPYPVRVIYLAHRDRCPFIAEVVPAPPKRFTIHGQEWKLIQIKSIENGDQAQTRCHDHLILIRSDIGTRQELAETVMHEVLHALACEGGEAHDERWNNSNDEADGCDGHCGLYWAGKELVAFMAENPELVRFIQENGKP